MLGDPEGLKQTMCLKKYPEDGMGPMKETTQENCDHVTKQR